MSSVVGIIGLGSVGAAVEAGMRLHFDVVGWDIDGRGSLTKVLSSDIVFVCVQTDGLDTHRLDVGEYPDSLEGLRENNDGRASWNGPYLRREVPLDPWGFEYVYESSGRGFTLLSYGPDGEVGGEGDDADIAL